MRIFTCEGIFRWVLELLWVTRGTQKWKVVVKFRRMDQINEPIKDNGNSFLIVWEESYQKEEKYWIGLGGISMNSCLQIYRNRWKI